MSIHLIRIRHFQQSSFRLNHWLPWDETHPKVMQRTANFHHQIADARLPEAAGAVDDAAALDTAVDVRDADAAACDAPLRRFLRARERPAPRLLGRHEALDLVEREGQEAQLLAPPAARGHGLRRGRRAPLVVSAARIDVAPKAAGAGGMAQPYMFHRLVCFRTTIIAHLLTRVLGALEAPVRPLVAPRGEAAAGCGAATGGSAGGCAKQTWRDPVEWES